MAKPKPPWATYRNYDIGELNSLDEDIFGDYYDTDQDIFVTYSEMLHSRYSHETITKNGPYLAIVLKVLSGPQVNNVASTNNGNLTKAISLNNFKSPQTEEKDKAYRPQPVKVIARIPEIDADIDFPDDEEDEARMAAHGEFHQMNNDKMLEQVIPGSLIWVSYDNLNNTTGYDGNPVGKILGLHEVGSFSQLESLVSAKSDFKPPCRSLRDMADPAGGLYIGHTEPNPVLFPGPPIRKFKGRIKTGIYGNGTAQTKQHFGYSLFLSSISPKYNIPGAAPWGENGAFTWVGHLRGNGYLDLVDRPISLGRETIIYAPGTLDLSSPIEIKYYLHDKGGFGNAWINGPNTTIEDSITTAEAILENDFREKIGPGIKDLIREGRNFILVIPEMSYSRGFGSTTASRINDIADGYDVGPGHTGDGATTVRTSMDLPSSAASRNYLRSLPISGDKDVMQVSHFSNREFSTFDGSYTGGHFNNFHYEVISVLKRHFPGIEEKIGYVSVIADGLGGIALAAISKDPMSVGAKDDAWRMFRTTPIKRIDFIDTGLDLVGAYSYFENYPPSYYIYRDFLLANDSVELNYITEYFPNPNDLFTILGQHEMFDKHNKPPSGLGERKFSFSSFPDAAAVGNTFISLHTAKRDAPNIKGKVGYAFSMINDYGSNLALLKNDSDGSISPSHRSVPDHAETCSKTQAAADAAKIQKKISDLTERIDFFEGVLLDLLSNGFTEYCTGEPIEGSSKVEVYCSLEGGVATNSSSQFFADYVSYITAKKDLAELQIISDFEGQLLSHSLYKPRLVDFKEWLTAQLPVAQLGANILSEEWDKLYENFDNGAFTEQFVINELGTWAATMAQPDAYEKIMLKVDNTIDKLSAQVVRLDPECAPPPIKLGEITSTNAPPKNEEEKDPTCRGKQIITPNNFDEIYAMISYAPKKSRFKITGKSSKIPTRLDEVSSFKLGTFKYQSRSANGQTTTSESPPIWSCLTDRLAAGWTTACNASNYTPFSIVRGIRGYEDYRGKTAYNWGMSLHAFGMAIDIDPTLAGYGKRTRPMYSVYTGAWTADLLTKHGQELYNLGVFKTKPRTLLKNAFQDENTLRMVENWRSAPSAYKGPDTGDNPKQKERYKKMMSVANGSPIIPRGSDPTKWLITFCESSGMYWGNAYFLKKRYRGGSTWDETEKKRISEIYGIPNIVDRIKAISWSTTSVEDHMHFQFWSGKSVVPWPQIVATKKRVG